MKSPSRSLDDIKGEIRLRTGKINPFERATTDDVEEVLGRLSSLDPDCWGLEWGKLGMRYEALGDEQEKRCQTSEAGESYERAYEYYRIGRYPVPSSKEKLNCYRGALRNFLKAAPYQDPPVERVEIPFEGKKIVGYLQIPRGSSRPPVLMHWGGVDGWKEDRKTNGQHFHRLGIATFAIDMPGAGENPLLAQEARAERTFSAALDHLEYRSEVDGKRIVVMGSSFGGYWATKLAYVEAGRLRGAVNWGAGVHHTFQEEWLRPALTERASQYLLGPNSLLDARAYIFRAKSLEEVLQLAPKLSLKAQAFLDKPNAPLLLVNGKEDDQHPVQDIYLLLEHGQPKEARIFPGAGHMGRVPGRSNHEVLDIVSQWIQRKLA